MHSFDSWRPMNATPLDLALPAGRVHAHAFGADGAPLALCIPGLSMNSRSFDFIAERVASDEREVVALELRGRGFSEATARGTYGWPNHARDVLDAASALGVTTFDVVGHSMGAYVALQAARTAPARIRRLVLIDGLGIPRYAAFRIILQGLDRLEAAYATENDYLAAVRAQGMFAPWSEYWERSFRYDLVSVDGRVHPRTNAAAIMEDVAYGASHDPRTLWHGLTMPVLVLRATVPLVGRDGFVLTEFDMESFLRAVPSAHATEIDANHLGILTHPETASAIRRFLF
jgi:pimeloyl-ACP methyl ester carboxylesterase